MANLNDRSGVMMRTVAYLAFSALALALAACANSSEAQPSVAEAARADCEARQVPAESMDVCIVEASEAIRVARERQDAPVPPPRRRPTLTR